jgi:DsbC/DsbD-like thiol-disulfide interchange protein
MNGRMALLAAFSLLRDGAGPGWDAARRCTARCSWVAAAFLVLVPAAQAQEEDVVSAKAWITPLQGDQPAHLVIEVEVAEGWHIYSLTQPKGGPSRTKIRLKGESLAKEPAFKATPKATAAFSEVFQLDVEEHEGRVLFFAPLELAAGVDVTKLKLEGSVNAQACNAKTCLIPKNYAFTATLDASKKPPKAEEEKDEKK